MLTTYTPPQFPAIANHPKLGKRTKHQYTKALQRMLAANVDPRNTEALSAYAATLPTSSRAFLKSALAIEVAGTVQALKANATPGNLSQTQAALLRFESMNDTIQVQQPKGERVHLWLSREQVEQITALPDLSTLEGRRDWILLGVLFGAGLRREELAELTFDALKTQPRQNGQMRYVLEVHGKGAKDRIVPISDIIARHLLAWRDEIGGGQIARNLKNGKLGASLSATGIYNLVQRYGAKMGLPELATHDTRRTFAQLAYNAGIPIKQISVLLGHSSVKTTEQYLNIQLDLEATASDTIPLSGD